jgi:hypothetical protein
MFGLGMGVGETIVAGGFVYFLFGRQELLALSRVGGRCIGHFVGSLRSTRAQIRQLTDGSDLSRLRQDLRTGIDEMQKIRDELAAAGSLRSLASAPRPAPRSAPRPTLTAPASFHGAPPARDAPAPTPFPSDRAAGSARRPASEAAATPPGRPLPHAAAGGEPLAGGTGAPTMEEAMRRVFSSEEYAAAVKSFSVNSVTAERASGADFAWRSVQALAAARTGAGPRRPAPPHGE